ncbi:hypothetical protein WJX72_009180 [[Myrmecia] bisecta]|uniref:Protein kinase domain-containing protein n=1 Tax=[Myrmecia] bisecta TaxID=41462 RepID=A0AAW1PKG5_9CHLO
MGCVQSKPGGRADAYRADDEAASKPAGAAAAAAAAKPATKASEGLSVSPEQPDIVAQLLRGSAGSGPAVPPPQPASPKKDGPSAVVKDGVAHLDARETDLKYFSGAPLCANDSDRCDALCSLNIDMMTSEPRFDFITKLMTSIFRCPVAMVVFIDNRFSYLNVPVALVVFIDNRHSYIKSGQGMAQIVPTDRRLSFCTWTLVPLKPEMLVVEDSLEDGRFAENPFVVNEPHIRFYAGAPLVSSRGHRLGSLCVVDYKPRKFDAESCNLLCNFATMVVRDVERQHEEDLQRRQSMQLSRENTQLMRAIDACSDGVVLVDVTYPKWPVMFSNEGWSTLTGMEKLASGSGRMFWDLFSCPGMSQQGHPWEVYKGAVSRGEAFSLDLIKHGGSGRHLFTVTFRPANDKLDEGMPNITIPALQGKEEDLETAQYYFCTIRRPAQHSGEPPLPPNQFPTKSAPFEDVRLGPLLGKGSFGAVYYGTWNGAQVAVKVIEHRSSTDEYRATDEALEAMLGLKMMHPNIVRTFKYATKERQQSLHSSNGMRSRSLEDSLSLSPSALSSSRRMMETWIVLELCNRGSLQEAIDKGSFRTKRSIYDGAPDLMRIIRTAIEIAGAMAYLHSMDILHSDLNGNNILLVSNTGIDDRPFSAKVSDFGLSRIHIGTGAVATETYGTVTHMPPELLSEGRLSKAADVYSFGVLLWELYTGQRPWAGLRHVQVIAHKMRSTTKLEFPPAVPAAYRDLADRCMATDDRARPPFSEALNVLLDLKDAVQSGAVKIEPFPVYRSYEPDKAAGKPRAIPDGCDGIRENPAAQAEANGAAVVTGVARC